MRLLILSVLFTTQMLATDFDKKTLFVKTSDVNAINSQLIKKTTHLFNNVYVVETTDVLELEKQLSKDGRIQSTQRNFISQKRRLPTPVPQAESVSHSSSLTQAAFNDPMLSRVWAFNDAENNGVSANKHYLTPLNRTKVPHIVTVADTGVDYNHEDLKDVMWTNPKEIPGNGIDDDLNGYIDDIYGIDVLNNDSDPAPYHSHGTHVAGTIAATQNNGIGIAGISSAARIQALAIVPATSDETDLDIVVGFLYAAKSGSKIINCSFGKKVNEGGMIVNDVINYIGKNYGTLVIAAAGNDSSNNDKKPKYPAAFDSDYLLTVASTNKRGGMSFFSNYGATTVDVAAPGSKILSTTPNNNYETYDGTSMAAPATAGVASEILGNFPNLTPLQLKKILIESVTKVDRFEGKMVSGGRVDLNNAIQYTLENYINL